MTKLSFCILASIFVCIASSCLFKVKEFTDEEQKWIKPFSKTDTIVFISENSELDTIIFKKKVATSESVRHFERGFYNINNLFVPYEFTIGSYNNFALMSDGETYYDQHLLSLSKSSAGFGHFKISFIGTIFSGDELKNIKKINNSTYYFDSDKATYAGINVRNRINSFTLDIEKGIIAYTDERNIQWQRKHYP